MNNPPCQATYNAGLPRTSKIGVMNKKKIVDEAREALLGMLQQQKAAEKQKKSIPKPKDTNFCVTPERQLRLHELSKDLREIRALLEISQYELGRRIGIDQTSISHWEVQKGIPTLESEQKLRKGLKLLRRQLQVFEAEPNLAKRRAMQKHSNKSRFHDRERNVYMIQRCTKCMRLSDRPCDEECPIVRKR